MDSEDKWFPGGMKIHAKDRAEAEWKAITALPYRCGTLTHDNVGTALLGHPQGVDWTGELTWTEGGTVIIRGDKPESTHSELKD